MSPIGFSFTSRAARASLLAGDVNRIGAPDECETHFHRGDPNQSGAIDISGAIGIFGFLFLGGAAPAPPGPPSVPCGLEPDPPGSAGDLGCGSCDRC